MNELHNGSYTGERALFQLKDTRIYDGVFGDGESPLKHSRNLELYRTEFNWKYPLWYSRDIIVENCVFNTMGRAGIWYTDNIKMTDTVYHAPKGFRRCRSVSLTDVTFTEASETLWQCSDVVMKNVFAKGDYFAMNSSGLEIDGLTLDGNYPFDGARDIVIRNSKLMSKDAFWNCENVTAENCFISGEYLGWNSKNLTFINCTIESLQGLCFIEDLVLKNCTLVDTTLAFEYSGVDAEIVGAIDSVKNLSHGRIVCGGIGELILESDQVDVSKTEIIYR